jgi:hypothetical protein
MDAGRVSSRPSRPRIADPISLRLDVWMAPKYHPTPLSGGDRKALTKELGKARAMTNILAAQSAEMRAKGAALIQQADKLLCESWNERMWADGEPIDPSPTVDQAIDGGYRRRPCSQQKRVRLICRDHQLGRKIDARLYP